MEVVFQVPSAVNTCTWYVCPVATCVGCNSAIAHFISIDSKIPISINCVGIERSSYSLTTSVFILPHEYF